MDIYRFNKINYISLQQNENKIGGKKRDKQNKGRFKDMKVGEIIEFHNEDFFKRTVLVEIVGKNEYKSFEDYFSNERLVCCLPGIKIWMMNLAILHNAYYKYFTKEDELQYGVVAIQMKLIKN